MANAAKNVDKNAVEGDWDSVVEPYADTWDFDKSPVLVGTYLASRQVEQDDLNNPGQKRMANVYEIESGTDGEKYSVWGTFAIDVAFLGDLQEDGSRKATGKEVQIGNQVRFEYQGKANLEGGKTVRKFVVQTRRV